MSQQRKAQEPSKETLDALRQSAKLLTVLCTLKESADEDMISTRLEALKAANPNIFHLLHQPFFTEIHQQLLAFATANAHPKLLQALKEPSTAPAIILPLETKKALLENLKQMLAPWIKKAIDQLMQAAQKSDSKSVRTLMPMLVEPQQSIQANLLLFGALENRNTAMVEALSPFLDFSHRLVKIKGETCFHKAVFNDDNASIKILVKVPGAKDQTVGDEDGRTPLMYAVGEKNIETTRDMLTISDVNAQTPEGATALYFAVQCQNMEAVSLMLKPPYSANILLSVIDGSNPFHLACQTGLIEMVRLFLSKMTREDVRKGKTNARALTIAANRGHWDIVQLLLPYYTADDIQVVFKRLTTIAVCDCDNPSCPSLTSDQDSARKALLNILESLDKIPLKIQPACLSMLHSAIVFKKEPREFITKVITLLVKKLPSKLVLYEKSSLSPLSSLQLAAERNPTALKLLIDLVDKEEFNRFMSIEASKNTNPQDTCVKLLAYASQTTEATQVLLARISPLHIKDLFRLIVSELCMLDRDSAQKEREITVSGCINFLTCLNELETLSSFHDQLEDLYADILALSVHDDFKGLIPLVMPHISAEKFGKYITPHFNSSCIHIVMMHGRLDILHHFLPRMTPEQIRSQSQKGKLTALHIAIERGNKEGVQLLIDATSIHDLIQLTDLHGRRPVDMATSCLNLDMLKFAIEKIKDEPGALAVRIPPQMRSFLSFAARKNSYESAAMIIPHLKPEEIHLLDAEDNLPLNYAVANNNEQLVQLLLENTHTLDDLNKACKQGSTPLMIAIQENFNNLAGLIIEKLLDLNAEVSDLTAAYALAVRTKNKIILDKFNDFAIRKGLAAFPQASPAVAPSLSSTAGVQKTLELKKAGFSFEKPWKALIEQSEAATDIGQKIKSRKVRDYKLFFINILPATQEKDDAMGSHQTPPQPAALESRAAFYQPAIPSLPTKDKMAEKHFYKVKFDHKKTSNDLYVHLSENVVKQARRQGVWSELEKFLRDSGFGFAGRKSGGQGLEKLHDGRTWLRIKTADLGDVRISTQVNPQIIKDKTADHYPVDILPIIYYGDHNSQPSFAPIASTSSCL